MTVSRGGEENNDRRQPAGGGDDGRQRSGGSHPFLRSMRGEGGRSEQRDGEQRVVRMEDGG